MSVKLEGAISVWDKKCKYCEWVKEFANRADVIITPYQDTFVAIPAGKQIEENEVVADNEYLEYVKKQYKAKNNQMAGEKIKKIASITDQINLLSNILIEILQMPKISEKIITQEQKELIQNLRNFIAQKDKIINEKNELNKQIDDEKILTI